MMQTNRANTPINKNRQQLLRQGNHQSSQEINWVPEIDWVPPLACLDEDRILLPLSQELIDLDYSYSDDCDSSEEDDDTEEMMDTLDDEPDFVLDADGFLVPLDGDDGDGDDDGEESISSLIGDDEDSIEMPYSELVERNPISKSFSNASSKSFSNSKSTATLSTEALTVSHTMDDSFFYSPRTPHTPHSQQQQSTPRKQLVNISGLSEQLVKTSLISPLPDPSPANDVLRRKILKQLFLDEQDDNHDEAAAGFHQQMMHQSFESILNWPPASKLKKTETKDPRRSSFIIPGITAPGRTLDEDVDAVKFQPQTPRRSFQKRTTTRLPTTTEQQQQEQQQQQDVSFQSPMKRVQVMAIPAAEPNTPRTPSSRKKKVMPMTRPSRSKTGTSTALFLHNSWDTTNHDNVALATAEPSTPKTPRSKQKVTARHPRSKSITDFMPSSPGGGGQSSAAMELFLSNAWDTTEDDVAAAEPSTPKAPRSKKKVTTRQGRSKSDTAFMPSSPGGEGQSSAAMELFLSNAWDTTEDDGAAVELEPSTPRTHRSKKKGTARHSRSKSVTAFTSSSPGRGRGQSSAAMALLPSNAWDINDDDVAAADLEPSTPKTPRSKKKVAARHSRSKTITAFTPSSPGGGGGGQLSSAMAAASNILDRPPTPRRRAVGRSNKLSAASPSSSSTPTKATTPRQHETSNSNRTASSSSRSSTANNTTKSSSSYDKEQHQSTPVPLPHRRSAASRRKASLLLGAIGPIPLSFSSSSQEEEEDEQQVSMTPKSTRR
jgi:hypothetical protein